MNAYKDKGILKSQPYAAVYEYKLNTTKGATKNVNIRKALAMSIDRDGLIKNVLKEQLTTDLLQLNLTCIMPQPKISVCNRYKSVLFFTI